ncbi:SDR family NAD(P)-dependent oxidoreductase [Rhizobium bangladeshense]|uniref:SDR family NAD(P)-dependent oxidoreductase n=1 Tax=Rhizobium bangladeshense TaxID=1138189 RepID=UPI0007E56083|nr:SDR family NAD(P)-dependent oxidoreductase [Rhizobium bangladeshense]
MRRFENKVVLVTGASKGIGAACARRFASEGASVVLNFHTDKEGAEKVARAIEHGEGKALVVGASVADEDDVIRMFGDIKSSFGQLDVLVNNAGVFKPASVEGIDSSDFDWHFRTNVLGMLMTSKHALNLFPATGGSIVNIGSTASTMAPAGGSLYAASKGAVTTAIKSLAKEFAPRGIRVNGVNPGYVITEGVQAAGLASAEFQAFMVAGTPLGRPGKAEEIAAAVAFLASVDASFVTGEILAVSGGSGM